MANATSKESEIERYLCEEVERRNGFTRKLQYVNRRGCPDRLVMLPGGAVHLIELKRPSGGRLSVHQRNEFDEFMARDYIVCVLYSKEDVDHWLEQVDGA
jgi:hypothetical protein